MDMLAPLMASWPVQALGLIALTKLALSALGLVWATVKPSGAPKAKGGASWAVVSAAAASCPPCHPSPPPPAAAR